MMVPKVGRAGEVLQAPRPALAETPDVTTGEALVRFISHPCARVTSPTGGRDVAIDYTIKAYPTLYRGKCMCPASAITYTDQTMGAWASATNEVQYRPGGTP